MSYNSDYNRRQKSLLEEEREKEKIFDKEKLDRYLTKLKDLGYTGFDVKKKKYFKPI